MPQDAGTRAVPSVAGASPLVGRGPELTQVRSALAAPPAIVVLEGEAGIGKSRLIRELVDAQPGDMPHGVAGAPPVLIGHCQQLHDPVPLGPVLDALRHHGQRLHGADLSPLVGVIGTLLPELADRLPPPPATPAEVSLHQVIRAAVELVGQLAPAVLVLEDLHWADTATFDFLTILAAHQPADLSVVVTTRTEAGGLPVGEVLARAPSGPARTVTLGPLDPAAVGDLAHHLLGVAVPAATAQALHQVTGGVPFVIEEVLRTLRDVVPANDIPRNPAAIAELSVSTALRDVVRMRLAGLDPVAAEVLQVAAVADLTVDPALVTAVGGHRPEQVAKALGAGYAAGLLHDTDSRSQFRHVLAQQIVADAVPTPTRRWLHLRIAETLAERGDEHAEARIAHHYRQAGRPAEFVRHAEVAADQAVRHGNSAVAADLLRQAAGEVDVLTIDDRVRLAAKLGRAAVDGLAHTEAVPILTQLLGSDELPPRDRGELRFALGRLYRQQGRAADGYREIECSIDDLAGRPDLQARALAVLAAPETVVDLPVAEHRERAERARAAAQRSGSPTVEVAVRIAEASLLLELGRPDVWRVIDAVRGDGVLHADPREHARAVVNWAQGALHIGRLVRADELIAEGRAVADRARLVRVDEVLALVAAMADHAAGRWVGLAERVRDLATRRFRFGAAALDARLLHGQVLACTGDAADADALLTDLLGDCERSGAVWPLVATRSALARLRLVAGDGDAAFAHAEAAVEQAARKGIWVWAADAMQTLVDAAVVGGRLDEVRPRVAAMAAGLDGVDAPVALGALCICRAVLARADGDATAADDLVEAARKVASEAGLVHAAALATERLGSWRCERDLPGGAGLLEQALRSFGALDARRDIARVTGLMRRHGVPVPYPWRGGRPAHGARLSRREQEVARLAAAGRTNREIAAELFLSQRTIETHIANALRKLELRSRTELAGRLELDDDSG